MFQTAVDRLDPAQRARWDDLRGQRVSCWPADLTTHVESQNPHNSEDIMEAIASWILNQSV